MLTVRPKSTKRSGLPAPDEIDLDESMLHQKPMKLHACGLWETISMPSEIPRNLRQCTDLSSLAQGKFQSGVQYLARQEEFDNTASKSKEGLIVEAFVDGIYHDK